MSVLVGNPEDRFSHNKALFRYMNWNINEPNFGESGENCAHYVHHATREWNDAVCGNSAHSLPSLCEITDPTASSCPGDANPASSDTKCPDGWCPFGGSCYLYVTTALVWYQSETLCKTLGKYHQYLDTFTCKYPLINLKFCRFVSPINF